LTFISWTNGNQFKDLNKSTVLDSLVFLFRMPSFLGGKSRGAFGQPEFFLAGNGMTIVAFDKRGFFKKLKFI